ncbi:MAG: hypothetical protein HC773_01335 [Scytonema sp. CRU_2_7]|nr:hypothetical protein [Scytonema sp. CRU_2_7]
MDHLTKEENMQQLKIEFRSNNEANDWFEKHNPYTYDGKEISDCVLEFSCAANGFCKPFVMLILKQTTKTN